MEYLSFYILGFSFGMIATFSGECLDGLMTRSYFAIENYKQRVTLKCHWWISLFLYGTFIIACFGQVVWLIKTLFSFI
jgi:ABC-type uncharacterized transport system permease subunit